MVVVKVVSDWETRAVRADVVMAEPVGEALPPMPPTPPPSVMVAEPEPLPDAPDPEAPEAPAPAPVAPAAPARTDEAPALCTFDAEPRASGDEC